MGAKQSKRSVDISGKEAESAGEVAAAGAGGEGRVEALADADALKPQANGAAHIHEQTDKEKQLDSGTPENEKDATTEKQGDGEKGEEKETAPVTNGEAEAKPENGESSPAAEDGKKPKKEKVKKKWSLRSISFSRKDKPKQEKKQKEEEPKSNGEPEKVPEEAAEVTPENAASNVAEEAKSESIKEDKTPETPVTEPMTNGSSTPETPKVESPAADEPVAPTASAPAPETDRPEPKAEVQPEQLPVNGLSLEEQKPDTPEAKNEESKPEEPAADTTETAPAPEIPVIKEVCVEKMPLETTPPPLPANPPPSSVASFAATTMAPELTNASLANTAELVISAPPVPEVTIDAIALPSSAETSDNSITVATEYSLPLKEPIDAKPAEPASIVSAEKIIENTQPETAHIEPELTKADVETEVINVPEPKVVRPEPELVKDELEMINLKPEVAKAVPEVVKTEPEVKPVTEHAQLESDAGDSEIEKVDVNKVIIMAAGDVLVQEQKVAPTEASPVEMKIESPEVEMPPAPIPEDLEIFDPAVDSLNTVEDLPSPPPPIEEEIPAIKEIEENIETVQENAHETKVNSNYMADNIEINCSNTEQLNENVDTEKENLKNKTKDSLGNVIETVECNGNASEESMDVSPGGESGTAAPAAPAAPPAPPASHGDLPPPPPADTQEPIPVSDKLADLMPEVPVVPELNTQTETSSDVAVAN